MAVAFDAVGPSSAGASSLAATTLSWSHTCTGTNRLVFVGVSLGKAGGNVTTWTMAATYGGTAMISLGTVASGPSLTGKIQAWYLVAPATGAQTVAITATGGTPGTLAGGSVSFTGVDQSSPVGTPQIAASSGNVTTVSLPVPGTKLGNFVVDVIGDGSGGETSTQTNRWKKDVDTASAAGNAAGSTAAGTGGTVTMGYTTALDSNGFIAVEILQAVTYIPPAIQPYTARRRASLF